MKDLLERTRRANNMTYPDPRFAEHVVTYVRDKIGTKPDFNLGTVRSKVAYMRIAEPWMLEIVLTESSDDLTIRFIEKEDEV
jgi:hypothetical protein